MDTTTSNFYSCQKRMFFLVAMLGACNVAAQSDLGALSIEELMSVEVTSAADTEEEVQNQAAAIFIISAEDIRRSGVVSIAEALRMVPGLHVARIDDTRWAVSARGFNDQFSNKLSVNIDGRHLNSPNNYGVFWDDHMPLIDNVERIEIVRGPGDAMQGLNAVNGSINIISRSARDTQGVFAQGRLGDSDINGITARYGSVTNSGWYYRLDYHSVDENVVDSPIDNGNADKLSQQKVSFRVDSPSSETLSAVIEGAYYLSDSIEVTRQLNFASGRPEIRQPFISEMDNSGYWLRADVSFDFSSRGVIDVAAYWEDTTRDYSLAKLTQRIFSLDVEGRHKTSAKNELIWGVEAYLGEFPIEARQGILTGTGQETDYDIYRVQVQDTLALSDKLSLSVGARLEKNRYIDWTANPNVRLSFKPTERVQVWAAASTASRMPSVSEQEHLISPVYLIPGFTDVNPAPLPIVVRTAAADSFAEESLTAIEAGIKLNLSENLSLDVSAFDFSYDDLLQLASSTVECAPSGISVQLDPSCLFFSGYLAVKTQINTELDADSSGVEFAVNWKPSSSWRLSASASLFDYDFSNANFDPQVGRLLGNVSEVGTQSEPEWLVYLRSEWEVSDTLDFDVTYRSVARSETFAIDAYNTFDIRLEWRMTPSVRIEFVGQNLADSDHVEFGTRTNDALPSVIGRGLFARLSWAP